MTDSEVRQILVAIGRVETEVKNLHKRNDAATKRLDTLDEKVGKLQVADAGDRVRWRWAAGALGLGITIGAAAIRVIGG